jgi:hypothetical protein
MEPIHAPIVSLGTKLGKKGPATFDTSWVFTP